MDIFKFQHPDYLYGLFLIPILWIIWIIAMRMQRKSWDTFGDNNLVNKLLPRVSYRLKNWKFVLFTFAIGSLFLSIANPQIGSKLDKVKRKGIDMIIAVDISNSMLAEDIKPDRLTRAKREISKLVDNLEGDRIGIIVFAGKAYTQLPITTDYSAAKMFLSSVNTDFISTQGTSIAAAIEMGRSTFKDAEDENKERNKAIIIITDGEDHEEGAVEQTKDAANEGIKIYTIGMGTAKGAPIPIFNNKQRVGYKKDNEGHTVISRFNESLLKTIAEEGNGVYVSASNSYSSLKIILDEINKMNKTEIETQTFKDYESRFQIFAAIAIILLLIETLLGERKTEIKRFNLFNNDNN